MRFGFSLLIGLWVLFTFAGCGDMLASLRKESREIDAEAERDRENSAEAIANYKPRTLRGLSANNTSEYSAPNASARTYARKLGSRAAAATDDLQGEVESAGRRVTRDDFVDRVDHDNSLWDGQGQSNYLFANNRRRENGDVITADVEKELRREIQYQLWMTLPPEQRKVRKPPGAAGTASDSVTNAAAGAAKDAAAGAAGDAAKKAGADKGIEAKAKDAAEEAAKSNMAPTGKDDDLIRMEVVETLGNGLVRVLGQKRVIYRGVSRVVEVAALLNSKDIDDSNHAKSGNFLDMKAQVIQ